jgi:uncharacterized repeat protein (TIGR03803 family)
MQKLALSVSGLLIVGAALGQSAEAYTHKVIHSFCVKADCADGDGPAGVLVMDAAGNLYGTTEGGGKVGANGFQDGVIFELSPSAGRVHWKYQVIHTFCRKQNCVDGYGAQSGLVIDVNGNLYGTTPYGGTDEGFGNGGVVFELSPSGSNWKYQVLHNFCKKQDCTDGDSPFTGLTYAGAVAGQPYDGASALYGTTFGGGRHPGIDGTAFSLAPDQATSKRQYDVLYNFCSAADCHTRLPNPSSAPAEGADGTLYLTTDQDGFDGNLVAVIPHGDNWRERTEHSFCALSGCLDGDHPQPDTLAIDGNGIVYGTTVDGASGSGGTIFSLDPATRHLTTLYNFCAQANCVDGAVPRSGVLLNSAGDLFGVTSRGGNNVQAGVAYELSHNGQFNVLYTFCAQTNCTDGSVPNSTLLMGHDGILYGMTDVGGTNNGGTVYELVP